MLTAINKNVGQTIPIGSDQIIDLANGINQYNLSVNFNTDDFFNHYIDNEKAQSWETYNPVVQKKLGNDQQNNIEIKGQFRTDFDVTKSNGVSGFSYITMRNNSIGKALAHGGYGVAWRPSEANSAVRAKATTIEGDILNISFANSNSTIADFNVSGDFMTAYIDNIPFEYSGTDPNQLTGVSLSSVASSIIADVNAPKIVTLANHNLMIVDNDYISLDLYAGKHVEYDGGALSYIKSGITEILPDTTYYFSLTIGAENELQFRVASNKSELYNGMPVISTGARTPLSEYMSTPDMDALAISVIDTKGYKWYYDNIKIGSLSREYPILFISMDSSDLPNFINAHFRAYAEGFSEDNSIEYGVELYVWNPTTLAWVLIGDNEYSSMGATNITRVSEDIEKANFESDGHIKLALMPSNPSGSLAELNSTIVVDFFKLQGVSNISVNIGGAVDVYLDDAYLKQDSVDFTPDTDNFMNNINEDRAIVWVDSVHIKGDENAVLTEGIDYVWAWNEDNFKYSSKVQDVIRLSNGLASELTLNYTYSPIVKAAQDVIDTDPNVSYKGQDVLVKHMAIHLLDLTATLLGKNIAEIMGLLNQYTKDLTLNENEQYVLIWDDFYNYLRDNGATSITALNILSKTRTGGKVVSSLLRKSGQSIVIDKYSVFKVKGLLDA
jgi:hypothetical protein